VNYRPKMVLTSVGSVVVERAYYHCGECRRGQIPYDRESGLGLGQLSNRLAASASLLAAHGSFAEAGRILQELTGVVVDDNTIAQTAERAGSVVVAGNDAAVRQALERREPPAAQVRPRRLYISADGTTAPTREGWREVKCAAVYWEDPAGPHQSRYTGRIEDCEAFGRRLWHLACECGFRETAEVVVIADGAPWIWNQVRLRFSRARQILDWYHASEHVWSCANEVYGEGAKQAAAWAKRMLGVLYEQGGRTLLERLRRWCRRRGKAPPGLRDLIRYVETNVERMDYPRYRKEGLPIGSGPVESACKRLVSGRLKGPGMRWNVAAADAILALRITWFNGTWHQLWRGKPLAALAG